MATTTTLPPAKQTRLSRKLLLSILLLTIAPVAAPASNNRSQCKSNLLQFAWALKAYREMHSSLPTDIYDDHGHALLSWRVRILPYIEHEPLYRQFHLNEPWDSEHNRRLIPEIPRTYGCPSSQAKTGLTTYVRLLGAEKVPACRSGRQSCRRLEQAG